VTTSPEKAERQRRFTVAFWAIALGVAIGVTSAESLVARALVVVGLAVAIYAVAEVARLVWRRHGPGVEPGPVHVSGFPLPAGRREESGRLEAVRTSAGGRRLAAIRGSDRFRTVCSSIILGTFAARYVDGSLVDNLSFAVGVTASLFVTFELLPWPNPQESDAG
jgi:hypothetical protein